MNNCPIKSFVAAFVRIIASSNRERADLRRPGEHRRSFLRAQRWVDDCRRDRSD
ncbi:MAG: hypothetical protein MZU97_19770 [Bacillus subtilis]|nr:hypothetical protein [Bacillus subtilis]